jgi:hypothetical protein
VFFSSAQPLVHEDVNGRVDVYEYDLASGALALISSGRDSADAWFLDASASGGDVFFVTREQLVGWDRDSAYDLYDARVGGGFPEPPPAATPCAGDACRGEAHAAPPLTSLASEGFVGEGNRRPAKPRRCRGGRVKRRVHGRRRCVRRHRRGRR